MSINQLTVREFPEASNSFLRFQLGHVPVFHLYGFGSTLEKATNMATQALSPFQFDN